MYKVYMSGYYKAGNDDIDFNESVLIPECDEEKILANVQNRVVHRYFANSGKPFTRLVKCWVDKYEKVNKDPAFVGKSIKEVDWDDIQDMAIAFDLNVPLYRACSLREARIAVYKEYCSKVKGMNLDANFNLVDAIDFTVGEKKANSRTSVKKATEDNLQGEFNSEQG
jgi:hypothetical protein